MKKIILLLLMFGAYSINLEAAIKEECAYHKLVEIQPNEMCEDCQNYKPYKDKYKKRYKYTYGQKKSRVRAPKLLTSVELGLIALLAYMSWDYPYSIKRGY